MTVKDRILKVLEGSENPLTTAQICNAIGATPGTVSGTLYYLSLKNKVKIIDNKGPRGGSRYQLNVPETIRFFFNRMENQDG